jgi:hypothetical protein
MICIRPAPPREAKVRPRRLYRLLKLPKIAFVAALLVWGGVEISSLPTHTQTLQDGQAWTSISQKMIMKPTITEVAHAEKKVKKQLSRDPLDGRLIRVLALAAAARGDDGQAIKFMNMAVVRSQADYQARSWLFEYSLAAGEFQLAFTHLGAIMRVKPGLLQSFIPHVEAAIRNKAASKALLGQLRDAPSWRKKLLLSLAGSEVKSSDIAGFYFDLVSSGANLLPAEINPYLERLVRDSHYGVANLLWKRWSPASVSDKLTWPFNRSFEDDPHGGPFDWQAIKVDGAETHFLKSDRAHGHRAIRVRFFGSRVPFSHLRQLLLLRPGRYKFSGLAWTSSLKTARGLRWTVFCAGASRKLVLGESDLISGGEETRKIALEFDVPGQSCPAQWLVLEMAGRIPSETAISGEIWFDAFKIQRSTK